MLAKVRKRATWVALVLVAAVIAAVILWPHARHEPPPRRRVTVVLVDRWEAGIVRPNAYGDYPVEATSKVVAWLHRDPSDSLVIVRYSRSGGHTHALHCSESTVGANAGWPVDRVDDDWTPEATCVAPGLERAASYLATQKGDRRIVIVSDDGRALDADIEARISRIAATGIAISRVGPDDGEALRRVIR